MRKAYFKYNDILLGTLINDEKTGYSSFFYTVSSWDVDNLTKIRPSILMELLESVRRDVNESNFDFDTYISKYDANGLHFELEK